MHNSEWICDDKPKPISPEIAKMSDEEIEKEFRKRFPNYSSKEKDGS